MRLVSWMVWVITAFAACGGDDGLMPVDTVGNSRVYRASIPLDTNQSFDILFVIDDSPAMAPFATKLDANAREMIQVLTPMFGPDLHVGVVTADPADAGKLRENASVAGNYLTTALQFDFTVQTNATGTFEDAFVALADVGSMGSTSIQPLAMAQAALAPGANPGFRRDDAFLGIVFITAGDDSSPGPVTDYAQALKQLVPSDPTNIVVSIASGPCTTSSLSAPDAPRLTAFGSQFPNRATQAAVCDDSLAALVSIEAQLIKTPLGAQCIDVALAMPPVCSFWLEHRATSEQRVIEPPIEHDSVLVHRCRPAVLAGAAHVIRARAVDPDGDGRDRGDRMRRRVVALLLLVVGCSESTCPMPTLAPNGDEIPPAPDPRMCALGLTAAPTEIVIAPVASCESGACLRVPLEHDLPTCGNFPPADEGLCTAACQADSDCDALAGPCVTGYACGVAVTVGPYCCERLCICKDYVDVDPTTPAPCDPADTTNTCCNLPGRAACAP